MVRVLDGSTVSLRGARVAIVVAKYNPHITQSLADAAIGTLVQGGIADQDVLLVEVPGAWELPQATQDLAAAGHFSGIVCLGAVIKGQTTHDQHLNRAISMQLCEMACRFNLPISLGVLMCNDVEQALQRSGGTMGNKGQEAAEAVLQMIRNQRALPEFLAGLECSDA